MGFSITLSELIIVVASVVLASGFSAYAIYSGNALQSQVMQAVDTVKRGANLHVEIVYATVNETTSPSHFVIYVKNVGHLPITSFEHIDVYVGEYGRGLLYTYDPNANTGSGHFRLIDADGDGVWEPSETAIIQAYPTRTVQGSLFEARIVVPRGIGSSYLFPAPP